jgi:hypothetical protein
MQNCTVGIGYGKTFPPVPQILSGVETVEPSTGFADPQGIKRVSIA